jgi:hypothetical protein
MAITLYSSTHAARMAKISPITLDSWMRTNEFQTESFAEHTKTHDRTFYFTDTDIARLTEFAQRTSRVRR